MISKIAGTYNQAGELVALTQASLIVLYQITPDGWVQADKYPLQIEGETNDLRMAMRGLAKKMDGCLVIVSKKAEGIAYFELNRQGFHIFEAETINNGVLNGIVRDLTEAEKNLQPTVPKDPFSPLRDDHYYLDLVKLQETNPEISSKRAFKSFLDNETFLSFTLLCAHIPPWVYEVADRRDLAIKVEQKPDGTVKAIIVPKRK